MAHPRKARTFTEAEKRKKAEKEAQLPSDLPQEAVEALNAISAPVDQILAAAREVGMTRGQVFGLIERLAVKKTDFRHNLRRITTRELIGKIEEKLGLVMNYLDEWGIAQASPKDLAIILSVLIEKRQLLLGEPTQILSYEERKHINELIPALVEEAKLRGMTIDLEPGGYEEIGSEYKAARVIPSSDRTGWEQKPANRRMLARKPS